MGGCCSTKFNDGVEFENAFDVIIKQQIKENQVILYSISTCEDWKKVKQTLRKSGIQFELFEVNHMSDNVDISRSLQRITRIAEAPYLFVAGRCIGGYTEMEVALANGSFQHSLKQARIPNNCPSIAVSSQIKYKMAWNNLGYNVKRLEDKYDFPVAPKQNDDKRLDAIRQMIEKQRVPVDPVMLPPTNPYLNRPRRRAGRLLSSNIVNQLSSSNSNTRLPVRLRQDRQTILSFNPHQEKNSDAQSSDYDPSTRSISIREKGPEVRQFHKPAYEQEKPYLRSRSRQNRYRRESSKSPIQQAGQMLSMRTSNSTTARTSRLPAKEMIPILQLIDMNPDRRPSMLMSPASSSRQYVSPTSTYRREISPAPSSQEYVRLVSHTRSLSNLARSQQREISQAATVRSELSPSPPSRGQRLVPPPRHEMIPAPPSRRDINLALSSPREISLKTPSLREMRPEPSSQVQSSLASPTRSEITQTPPPRREILMPPSRSNMTPTSSSYRFDSPAPSSQRQVSLASSLNEQNPVTPEQREKSPDSTGKDTAIFDIFHESEMKTENQTKTPANPPSPKVLFTINWASSENSEEKDEQDIFGHSEITSKQPEDLLDKEKQSIEDSATLESVDAIVSITLDSESDGKEVSILSQEHFPESEAYDLKDLQQLFEAYISSIQKTPMEEYEILLYLTTAKFKENENQLDRMITQDLYIIINALVGKWELGNFSNYEYRFHEDLKNMDMLDYEKLTTQYVSVETLNFFLMVMEDITLNQQVSQKTWEKVKNVFTKASLVANMLIKLNSDSNFEEWASIEGYLAAKHKHLRDMGYEPDYSTCFTPKYAQLEISQSWYQDQRNKNDKLKVFRDELKSFESEFREVEKEILTIFVNSHVK